MCIANAHLREAESWARNGACSPGCPELRGKVFQPNMPWDSQKDDVAVFFAGFIDRDRKARNCACKKSCPYTMTRGTGPATQNPGASRGPQWNECVRMLRFLSVMLLSIHKTLLPYVAMADILRCWMGDPSSNIVGSLRLFKDGQKDWFFKNTLTGVLTCLFTKRAIAKRRD